MSCLILVHSWAVWSAARALKSQDMVPESLYRGSIWRIGCASLPSHARTDGVALKLQQAQAP